MTSSLRYKRTSESALWRPSFLLQNVQRLKLISPNKNEKLTLQNTTKLFVIIISQFGLVMVESWPCYLVIKEITESGDYKVSEQVNFEL